MNRFNSYYDYNMYNPSFNNMRNSVPFTPPRMGARDGVIPKKGLTLSSTLTTVEKGIDTVSSLIPIYQKVKPVIENGKDIFNVVKSKLVKKEPVKETKVEKVDVEIVQEEKAPIKEKVKEKEKEETKPNNPFF